MPVEVGSTSSLAQAVELQEEVHVLGVDVPLSSPQAVLSGLHIAFQTDDDGRPSGDVLHGGDDRPASADVRVERPLPNQSTWGMATFTTPVRLQAAQRYWLVLQSTQGKAFWDATPGTAEPPAVLAPPLLRSDDGGLSWHAATVAGSTQAFAALIRLRHQVDHFTIPIQLQIGSGPSAVRRKLSEFDPLGRVEFTFDFAEALAAHLASQVTAAPCVSGELLVNGSFDAPPTDDAARRLFGFDAASGSAITGTVDLSQGVSLSSQRFITLAFDNEAPQRINCAGINAAQTTLAGIVAAINRAVGREAASIINKKFLAVNARNVSGAQVDLLPWRPPGAPEGWFQVGASDDISPGVMSISRVRLPIRLPQSLSMASRPTDQSAAERIVAVLEADAVEPAILAQCVPVSAGCAYALRCQFDPRRLACRASEQEPPATAAWEVHWRGANGQDIRVDSGTLETEDEGMGFVPLEVLLTAPQEAVQAELWFIQPPPGLLLLDDVSFRATGERLLNSTFVLWKAAVDSVAPRQPQGWTVANGSAVQTTEGAQLISDSLDDAVLVQTVDIKGGGMHAMTIQASATPAGDADASPPSARARLELRWLGDGPIGVPLIIPLDGRDFSTRSWSGAAPASAKQAEVRLIQPMGGRALILNNVTLTELDTIRVPLIFLSETSGELTLSNLRVAYDLPSAPMQRRPVVRDLSDALAAQPRSRSVLAPLVASPLEPAPVEPVAPAAPPPPRSGEVVSAPVETRDLSIPAPTAVPVEVEAAPAAGPLGLAGIKGIGQVRARRLADTGISSLADLAAAIPQDIMTRLRGVTAAAAEDFIRQARQLVGSGLEPPPPPPPSTDLPLTLVHGLGAARVARLTEVGIDTLQKLAEAAPEDVARVLRGVSVADAARFIETARHVLKADSGGTP